MAAVKSRTQRRVDTMPASAHPAARIRRRSGPTRRSHAPSNSPGGPPSGTPLGRPHRAARPIRDRVHTEQDTLPERTRCGAVFRSQNPPPAPHAPGRPSSRATPSPATSTVAAGTGTDPVPIRTQSTPSDTFLVNPPSTARFADATPGRPPAPARTNKPPPGTRRVTRAQETSTHRVKRPRNRGPHRTRRWQRRTGHRAAPTSRGHDQPPGHIHRRSGVKARRAVRCHVRTEPNAPGRPDAMRGAQALHGDDTHRDEDHGSRHAHAAVAHQRADGRHRPPPRGRATRRANVRDDHKTRYEFGDPLKDTHLAGETQKSRRTPTRRRSKKRLAATIESVEAGWSSTSATTTRTTGSACSGSRRGASVTWSPSSAAPPRSRPGSGPPHPGNGSTTAPTATSSRRTSCAARRRRRPRASRSTCARA